VLWRRRNDINIGDDKNPVKYFFFDVLAFLSLLFIFFFSYLSFTCSSSFSLGSATYHSCLSSSSPSLSLLSFPFSAKKTLLIFSANSQETKTKKHKQNKTKKSKKLTKINPKKRQKRPFFCKHV